MMTFQPNPDTIDSQLHIIRRIADRGLAFAHKKDTEFVDLFQHILDETERTLYILKEYNT
jgi:hypothetical protein